MKQHKVCTALLLMGFLSSCANLGSDDSSTYADAPRKVSEPQAYSEAWFDQRDFVVAPWVHQFQLEDLEGVSVEEDRIVFPRAGNERLEKVEINDILWAPVLNWELSFGKRVDAIVVDDEDYIFYTRYVGLDEIFLKLDYELGDADLEQRILGHDPWSDPEKREYLGYDPGDLDDPVVRQMLDTGERTYKDKKFGLPKIKVELCKVANVDTLVPCTSGDLVDSTDTNSKSFKQHNRSSVFKALAGLSFKPEFTLSGSSRLEVKIGSPRGWFGGTPPSSDTFTADECRCVASHYSDDKGPNYSAMYAGDFRYSQSGVTPLGGGNRIGKDGQSVPNHLASLGRDSCFRHVTSNSGDCAPGQTWNSNAGQCVLIKYQSSLRKWGGTDAAAMVYIDKLLAMGAEKTEVSTEQLHNYMKRVSDVYRNHGAFLDKDDPNDWPIIDRILDDRRKELRKTYTEYFTKIRSQCAGTAKKFYLSTANEAEIRLENMELEFYKAHEKERSTTSMKTKAWEDKDNFYQFQIPGPPLVVTPVVQGKVNVKFGVKYGFGSRILFSWKNNPPTIVIPRLGGIIDYDSSRPKNNELQTRKIIDEGFNFGCKPGDKIADCVPEIELGGKVEFESTIGPSFKLKFFGLLGPTLNVGGKVAVGFEAGVGSGGAKCEVGFGLGVFATFAGEIALPFFKGSEWAMSLVDSCNSHSKTNKSPEDRILAHLCLPIKHDFCAGPTADFVEIDVYSLQGEACFTPTGVEIDTVKVTDGDGNVNKITEVQIDGGSWSTSDAKKVEISNCTMSPCENIFHVCDHATWPSKVVNGSQVLRFRTENPIKVGSKVQVIRQEFGAVNQSDTFVPTSACGGGMHPCKLTGGFHVYLSKAVDGVYIKGSEKLFSMEGKLNHEASVDTGNVPK